MCVVYKKNTQQHFHESDVSEVALPRDADERLGNGFCAFGWDKFSEKLLRWILRNEQWAGSDGAKGRRRVAQRWFSYFIWGEGLSQKFRGKYKTLSRVINHVENCKSVTNSRHKIRRRCYSECNSLNLRCGKLALFWSKMKEMKQSLRFHSLFHFFPLWQRINNFFFFVANFQCHFLLPLFFNFFYFCRQFPMSFLAVINFQFLLFMSSIFKFKCRTSIAKQKLSAHSRRWCT